MYVLFNVILVLGYFVRVNGRRGEKLKLKTRRDHYFGQFLHSINL